MSYSDKLKDPRWQKKRLEIFQRDGFACKHCNDQESTLHVHHRYYEFNKDPWEYNDAALVTLCASCHEQEELLKSEVKNFTRVWQEAGFPNLDLSWMAFNLKELFKEVPNDDIVLLINFLNNYPDFRSEVIQKAHQLAQQRKKLLDEDRELPF